MRGRLEAAAAGAALLLAGVYGAFVRTATGQRWENAVLAGRREDETLAAARAANRLLDHITLSSLGAAVAVLLLIGLARRRFALTVVAVGTVGVSLLLAEMLKRYALPRPDLVNAPERLLGNSFPSGHTTIAMSVLFGLTLVVPYRWRGVAVGVCALWATFIGAYTVAAGWHRPSDTIGADLLVLAVACALTALLARSGRVRPVADHARPLRALFVIAPLCGVALAGLGCGTVLLVDSMFRLPPGDPAVPRLAYAGGHVLAAGASAAVTLVLLALLHRVDLDRPQRPHGT
ncbi:phosphoesterase [Streptomyces corchorusii]|uniref:Phosphoesterase n=2 Tax=Streptomyces TaxID=1883 RepID=A0A101PRJ9_STRCK|nr:phosphatase PAP2 family protein [Streptomyces corchorusii]KUN16143.1 phosphoesterase [Streptomyces corchorusii]